MYYLDLQHMRKKKEQENEFYLCNLVMLLAKFQKVSKNQNHFKTLFTSCNQKAVKMSKFVLQI